MSEYELKRFLRKLCKLKELQRARERVKQLERELRGEAVNSEDPKYVPEFLRVGVKSGMVPVDAIPPRERGAY